MTILQCVSIFPIRHVFVTKNAQALTPLSLKHERLKQILL